MSTESRLAGQLEIGHVLFMDVVGYSKLLLDEQRAVQGRLNEIVRATEQFRVADAAGKLLRLPAGDGMALVFFTSPEAPLKCAIEVSQALKRFPDLRVRMGIHSGPVNVVKDIDDRTNIAGAGINLAQRVMDCADAEHILVSKRVAEDLAQSAQWQPYLHDLGECEVKHGAKIQIFNFHNREVGNLQIPEKIRALPVSKPCRRNRWLGAVILLCAVVGFLVYEKRFAAVRISDKSIAVLPFVNMSADPENAFFADGIQDDILTALAKIRDLRVISRTSVEKYRGSKESRNLRQIGKALGVANVLEGSVRRVGERMVMNVQLIDAVQDRHLWANKYDLTLQDSLGIDGQVAREIASALSANVTADEAARVTDKPTANPHAYDLFLQAKEYEFKPDTFLQDYRTAEQLYVQAITLDPKFALAHARLAATRARIYHFFEPTEAWSKSARAEAMVALQMQPNLAEAHHALGLCYYWFDRNYAEALREFGIAQALSPNDSSIAWDMGAIKRRQGKWNEALADYRRILTLDPQNANVVRDLLYVYYAMRDWPNAETTAQRLLALTPDSVNAKAQIGYVEFSAKGDTARLKQEMATVAPGKDPDGAVSAYRMDASLIDRDWSTAAAILQSSPLENFSYFNGVDTPRSFFAGEIALLRGDQATARKELERARDIFAVAAQEAPEVPERHAFLGLTCALLREKQRAINEGKRAVELRPESKDALDGTIMNAVLAMIYARTGETARSLELLEHLIAIPGPVDTANYSITVNDLKYRWEWDPIRDDPRFQKLISAQP
jgi:TolB-like protein/class 3 adenylate cyclase/Tfp pilus assembly protein PilF